MLKVAKESSYDVHCKITLHCGIVAKNYIVASSVFFDFPQSLLFPVKTDVCLDSLIPGLEPPQAQLHPVEAEPVSSALAGKNMHQRWTEEPLPSIITPCQRHQWWQNAVYVERVPEAMTDFTHLKPCHLNYFFPHIIKDAECCTLSS